MKPVTDNPNAPRDPSKPTMTLRTNLTATPAPNRMTNPSSPATSPTARRFPLVPVLVAAALILPAFLPGLTPASATLTIPVDDSDPVDVAPGTPIATSLRKQVVTLARTELRKNVRERRGDNVPRYRFGRGRIAPYSIGDQWCVAFSTWAWSRVGFNAYLGTRYLRTSYGGTEVAIQVADLSTWARRNGYWTYRATPGDLVAYGDRHIGIVVKVDRDGRGVRSIEGNQGNGVRLVDIPMEEVSGYVSPLPLTPAQKVSRLSSRADVD